MHVFQIHETVVLCFLGTSLYPSSLSSRGGLTDCEVDLYYSAALLIVFQNLGWIQDERCHILSWEVCGFINWQHSEAQAVCVQRIQFVFFFRTEMAFQFLKQLIILLLTMLYISQMVLDGLVSVSKVTTTLLARSLCPLFLEDASATVLVTWKKLWE